MAKKNYSRRHFIKDLSIGMGVSTIAPSLASFAACRNQKDRLGVALVGLGRYSTGQLGPALEHTKNCYLAGIVTGTPSKEPIWAAKYNIPSKNIYNYQNFDSLANNPDIDIVYVVLPVSMHKEYTIRAAKAGKHVICEKPMALSTNECQEMIDACKKANRMLSIGYRLHFEPYNLEMMRLGQQKVYGKVLKLDMDNGFTYGGGDPQAWRLKKAMAGGGSMMDMGVYVVQGGRYVTGEEPTFISNAREEKTRPELFKEVDETIFWEMEFPGGAVATCRSTYNAHSNHLKVVAEKGSFGLNSAYQYSAKSGYTPAGPMTLEQNMYPQATHMDEFTQCIRNNRIIRVPGEEGMKDMKVIEAIYRSLASGKKERV